MFRALLTLKRRGRTLDDEVGGIFHSIRFWQGWAVAATLAALFAFAANIEFSSDGYVADYVAIVGGDDREPMWVINADLGEGLLNVRAVGAQSAGDDEYVLWVGGQHPQRLGVLPVDRGRAALKLSDTVQGILAHAKTLAVSREAVGTDSEPGNWLHEVSVARL